MSRRWCAGVAVLAVVMAGCGGGDPAGENADPIVLQADVREVVAGAARSRLTTYNSFGSTVVFDRVNIVERYGTVDKYGMLQVEPGSPIIPDDVRGAIETAVAPMAVTWVGNIDEVLGADIESPTYETVGAVLTLGEPAVDGDEATVATGLWCGFVCGAGGALALERSAGSRWTVTGPEGLQWVS